MRIGIIFNPFSGGSGRFAAIGKKLSKICLSHELFTGPVLYGENYLQATSVVGLQDPDFMEGLDSILGAFFTYNISMLIGIGGDGFLSHIAGWMIRHEKSVPVLGVAGGTANIGPLHTCSETQLLKIDLNRHLTSEDVGCLAVATGGRDIGYGFCDVIIGDTFLGTLNGKSCNLSAEAFIEHGVKVEKRPEAIPAQKRLKFRRDGIEQSYRMGHAAQVIAAPLYRREFYRGKAVTGALCFSPYDDVSAAIVFADKIIVDSQKKIGNESIIIEQFLFKPGECITVDDIPDGMYVIVDGNVFPISDHTISIQSLPDSIRAVRLITNNEISII